MKGQFIQRAKRLRREITAMRGVISLSVALLMALYLPGALAEGLEAEQVDMQVEETECFLMEEDADLQEMAQDEDGVQIVEAPIPETDGEALPGEEEATETVCFRCEKVAHVEGTDCTVVVRYDSDSGIPEDAELTAWRIDAGSEECGLGSDYELCAMCLSLKANGTDYASDYRYEVEVIMDTPAYAQNGDVRAMRLEGDGTTMLDAWAETGADGSVESVSFQANA